MFNDFKIVLGIAPTRRQMYDPKYAIENKRRIIAKVKELTKDDVNVEIHDIDWLNEEGILIKGSDSETVAEYFKSKHVDALFVPFCNYGSEEAVGRLGRSMGVPFLLYGARDEFPPEEGMRVRQTDTQCGMLPASKVLQRYGVKFTYIENCWLDDPAFSKGFDNFLRVATVVKKFKRLRVGQMSLRPAPFVCCAYNEGELLEKLGIEVVPISPLTLERSIKNIIETRADECKEVIAQYKDSWTVCDPETDPRMAELKKQSGMARRFGLITDIDDRMMAHAAMRIAILELAKENQLDAMGVECWMATMYAGIAACAVFGDIIEQGLPIGCETDVMCAITQVILEAASRGEKKAFCADVTMRHPTNDNAELLWHCGPFPVCTARKDKPAENRNMRGWFEVEHGDITISRLDTLDGKYSLLAGEGKGVDGPPTNGTYSWFEVKDWVAFEKKLIYGPYIHHVAGIHGHYGDVLEEACRYLPVAIDRAE
ncbi:MAG: L-fucose/L-arabinose isomerase family protein [Christensenellales bacterium]